MSDCSSEIQTFAHIPVMVKDIEVHFGAFKDNLSNGIVMQPVLKLWNLQTVKHKLSVEEFSLWMESFFLNQKLSGKWKMITDGQSLECITKMSLKRFKQKKHLTILHKMKTGFCASSKP